jgi:hypothetical protein
MPDLSILIPARNEQWLPNTVEDIVTQMRGDTEVIVVLDGAWQSGDGLPRHDRVQVIHHGVSIGQRAATNEAARLSTAKFIMKVDAHCRFDEGFDVKLMANCDRDWTVIPRMYNLHVFSWQCTVCKYTDDVKLYQGPMPGTGGSKIKECPQCQQVSGAWAQRLVWQPRWSRKSDFARFDSELHFQYWGDFGRRPEAQGEIADTMSSIGACWFMHRERFWELGGLDEAHGSWGQMGTEIACKTWLSGGRQVVNKNTWFSHLFRTQQGFTFPYPLADGQVHAARRYSQATWRGNQWPGQVRPLSWLLDKFWPVPGWTEEARTEVQNAGRVFVPAGLSSQALGKTGVPSPVESSVEGSQPGDVVAGHDGARFGNRVAGPSKALVYYSDCRLDPTIAQAVIAQIKRAANGHETVAVTLKPWPTGFDEHVLVPLERGYLTMFKQILAGLERAKADIVFLVEHDVLYHPTHFAFTPRKRDVYYYNQNCWKVDATSGQALFYYCNQTSQLCAYRDLLVEHYRARVKRVEAEGFTRAMGFEPGTHSRPRGIDDYQHAVWMSPYPNLDIRHDTNLTQNRWSQDQFRNKKFCQGWTMADDVPGWGRTKGRMAELFTGGLG